MSVGVASKDLPFGLLPSNRISTFVNRVKEIYPAIASDFDILNSISEDCLICMIKGFKPRGDDNRPDRGILPFAAMLTSEKVYILSYIYGPLIERNYRLLLSDPLRLSEISGFWRAFLSLSDFILLDAPLLNTPKIINGFIDNRNIKQKYITKKPTDDFSIPVISNVPTGYHEDDVDTGLHYIFSYLLDNTFEGMCNPPGGDWSGLSVQLNNTEYRWLSLPRVSNANKRPDHVAELFVPDCKPILFVVESKEHGNDLEPDIGPRLKGYILWLMGFTPSVSKDNGGEWRNAEKVVDVEKFEIISAGAYINDKRHDNQQILHNSKCDLLFLLSPDEENAFWEMDILANPTSKKVVPIQQILFDRLAGENSKIYIATTKKL